MQNYIFESFVKLNDEQKKFFIDTIKQNHMIPDDANIVALGEWLKSINRNFPELKDASIGDKMDKLREVLVARDAYNSVLVTTSYKNETSLVKMMSNESVIIDITYGKSTSVEFLNKDEYLDKQECNVGYLQEFVDHDGSDLDKRVTAYEQAARYMDLPDLHIRRPDLGIDEPMLHYEFTRHFSFHTYDGGDDEVKYIEGTMSRKTLLKRTRTSYSKADVEARLEYLDAVNKFIIDNPDQIDLFDALDIVRCPSCYAKHRWNPLSNTARVCPICGFDTTPAGLNKSGADIDAAWVGMDEDGSLVFSGSDDESDED